MIAFVSSQLQFCVCGADIEYSILQQQSACRDPSHPDTDLLRLGADLVNDGSLLVQSADSSWFGGEAVLFRTVLPTTPPGLMIESPTDAKIPQHVALSMVFSTLLFLSCESQSKLPISVGSDLHQLQYQHHKKSHKLQALRTCAPDFGTDTNNIAKPVSKLTKERC